MFKAILSPDLVFEISNLKRLGAPPPPAWCAETYQRSTMGTNLNHPMDLGVQQDARAAGPLLGGLE
jgi:hypothetical protein